MIGTKLGPYDIIEEIGSGGMATVYRAYQASMERFVAIKVVKSAVLKAEDMRERFRREARLVARLAHPHVVPVYDFDGSGDPPYIVMRYLEGGTLKEVLANRRLPAGEIAFLVRQIGSALDYAHRQGIIHRDLKPSNIMIDLEGNAFLTDFGIARLADRQPTVDGVDALGVVIGTPDYMSPEQIMGQEKIDHRADIYSLGALFFQLITGRLPFESDSSMGVMLMHLRDTPPRASAVAPELPPEFDIIFQRALEKEPSRRYPSVNGFTEVLLGVLGDPSIAVPTHLRLAAIESNLQKHDNLDGDSPVSVRTVDTPPGEQNKPITAVFMDAAEYAEIVDARLGIEAAQRAMNSLWRTATEIVGDFGGTVFNQNNQTILAVWGAEAAREDDAEQAVRAALVIRDVLQEWSTGLIAGDEPLPIGIGVNTGLALLVMSQTTGSYTASGAPIRLAGNLAGSANGQVLITHDTFRHIRGVFEIEEFAPLRLLRNGAQSFVGTYRVTAPKPRAFRLRPRGIEGVDTRMIGRRAELEQLQKAYFNAVEDAETQMVTIIGDPGIGKSRLLHEFATWAELRPQMYFIFRGRATPATTSRPYALWRDLISFRFQIFDSDEPQVVCQKMELGVAELIGTDNALAHMMGYLAGFDFAGSPHLHGEARAIADQARQAVINFISRLSAEDPVVFQIDDLHHADEASLDLLAEIVSANLKQPLLVVNSARPDLYARRPAWGSGQDFHLRLDLRPLDKRDSRDLVAEIFQKVPDLPRSLRDLIVQRAEGNPFYMEELVKMLLEDRVIMKVNEGLWTVEPSRLDKLRVPPTLVGLLQARFDSLLYPEKLALQRASVFGRVFYDGALQSMDAVDETRIDDLPAVLTRLADREFIYPRETPAFTGSREYIFAQAMLRDLILETLLDRQLKAYSRSAAGWLAEQSGERAGEYDALIAEHYERAGEAGLAADYLSKAGNAAVACGALEEAIQILQRSLVLVEGLEPAGRRLALQLQLGGVYSWKGDYANARLHLEPALEAARLMGERLAEANALAQLGRISGTWEGDYSSSRSQLQNALDIARELGDRPSLLFILRQLGNLEYVTGSFSRATKLLKESLILARQENDIYSVANALNSLAECARFEADYTTALAYYEQSIDALGDLKAPNIRALVMTNKGYLHLATGDFVDARLAAETALNKAREIGTEYLIAGCLHILGAVAVELGQDELARGFLKQSIAMFWKMGNIPGLLAVIAECARVAARDAYATSARDWLNVVVSHPALAPDGRQRAQRALKELDSEIGAVDSGQTGDINLEMLVASIRQTL